MPIKKSSLEKKWYYRIANVFFSVLPLLVVVVAVLRGYVNISGISQKNISAVFEQNIVYIISAIIGLVLYYQVIPKLFFYLLFGGIEDDTKKKDGVTTHPVDQPTNISALTPSDKNQVVGWILMLIVIGGIYYAYFIYKSPQNPIVPEPEPSQCISTGCGNLWRCDGSYYDANGVQRSLHACLPRKAGETYSSWSGTCRQCP